MSKFSREVSELQYRITIDQDYKLAIIENMRTYGGSFVKCLAECFATADGNNLRRLTRTFITYVREYLPEKWEVSKGGV